MQPGNNIHYLPKIEIIIFEIVYLFKILLYCIMKSTKGGKRKGAGRKKRYGEETISVSFKCPKSKVFQARLVIAKMLMSYEKISK